MVISTISNRIELVAEKGQSIHVVTRDVHIAALIWDGVRCVDEDASCNAELSAKIQQGIQLSVDRVIQRKAVEGESVVIGDVGGNVKVVAAREALMI